MKLLKGFRESIQEIKEERKAMKEAEKLDEERFLVILEETTIRISRYHIIILVVAFSMVSAIFLEWATR